MQYAIKMIDGEDYYSRLSFTDKDCMLYKLKNAIATYCSPISETRWTQNLTQAWDNSKRKIHCKKMNMLQNFDIAELAPRY